MSFAHSFELDKSSQLESKIASMEPPQVEVTKTPSPTVCDQLKESTLRLRDATISQTSQERFILRSAWVLIYIGVIACLVTQFGNLIQKYFNYPTDIDIVIISKPQLEFPAVTVCNENPLRKSLVGRIRDLDDFQQLDKYVMSSVKSFAKEAFDNDKPAKCGKG